MQVSCLICCHSTSDAYDKMLLRAIDSVVGGTMYPDEIVVVLNACHDKTYALLDKKAEEFPVPTIMLFVNKAIKNGLASAKNFGLNFCNGDWITYCDADDQWTHDKLETQINYITRSEQEGRPLDFVSTECWDIYPDGRQSESYYACGVYENHDDIAKCFARGENCMVHGSMMIRRNALRILGGYRDVRGAEDFDLWKRAVSAGYRFAKIPARCYLYSMGTGVPR